MKKDTISMVCFFLMAMAPLLTLGQEDYVEPPLEQIRKPYKLADNLMYGGSVGGSLSLSEFAREERWATMLRPTLDFHFGKHFNEAFASRITLGYHCQAGSIGDDAYQRYMTSGNQTSNDLGPTYAIHMANIGIDGLLNLNRVMGSRNQTARIKARLLGGVGLNWVAGYGSKTAAWAQYVDFDRSSKIAPECHIGAMVSLRGNEKTDIDLQCTWHQTSKEYDGMGTAQGNGRYLEMGIGFSIRALNRYASYIFENCRGNEKYYFERSESKMLEEHERDNKRLAKSGAQEIMHPSDCESVLSFPHTYAYLTPRQVAKLQRMAETLMADSTLAARIDIYPHTTTKDEISPISSVDRCHEQIMQALGQMWEDKAEMPVRFVFHSDCASPINPDGIWFHNALISYEKRHERQ